MWHPFIRWHTPPDQYLHGGGHDGCEDEIFSSLEGNEIAVANNWMTKNTKAKSRLFLESMIISNRN